MRKRLKHISELPDWFKLEKYIGAIKLTTQGWYTQLAIRKCYLEYQSLGNINEPIAIIRNKPLVSIDDHEIFPCWVIAACKVDINPYCPSETSLGVNSLTMAEYFKMQKNIIPQRKKFEPKSLFSFIKQAAEQAMTNSLHDQNINITIDELDESAKQVLDHESWLNFPVFKSSYPNSLAEGVVSINLNYTDEILIEHFKRWLSQMRLAKQQEFKSKNYLQYNYNDWVQYGVLPYLDLKGWEIENNIQIPNRVMADAIYPRGEGGEETVRKTTKPLVKNLLSQKSLSQLAGQISLEIPEQKSL